MTVTSFTDSTKSYEVTETSCSVATGSTGDAKTNRPCKHMIALQMGKDAAFKALRNRYDYRLNGTLETRKFNLDLANCY